MSCLWFSFPFKMVPVGKKNLLYLDPKDNAILPRIRVYIITGPKTNDAALPMHLLLWWGESAVTPTCEPSETLVGESLWKTPWNHLAQQTEWMVFSALLLPGLPPMALVAALSQRQFTAE